MAFRDTIRIRYGEVDQQGVVFNAHYLAFIDHVMDSWLRSLAPRFEDLGFDVMLKKAVIEWHAGATTWDELVVEAALTRVGTTSLDIEFEGAVADRPIFSSIVTYVCVDPVEHRPIPVPDSLRAHLSR